MSELIPILLLGSLILVFSARLLIQWGRRRDKQVVTIDEYFRARVALDAIFADTSAIKRVFASEDMEFISRDGTPDIQRFFLMERRDIAVQWLRMTRRQVAHLMDLHLKLASYTYEPSPKFEFRLTLTHLWFRLSSNVLLVLLWLRGPFEAVRFVGYTLSMAEGFCSAFSLRLEKADPAKLARRRNPA